MQTSPEQHPIEFNGKASEFFGIWIVNICLSILTLGIYSAWAKVRTNRYFYGNTVLDGASFQYLATPWQILKGRIVVLLAFALFYGASYISPSLSLGLTLLLVLVFPALVVSSLAFRMRYTAYRNVTFDFERNYSRAYLIYGLPVLMVALYIWGITEFPFDPENSKTLDSPWLRALLVMPLLIALFYPYWEYLFAKFRIEHTRFGTATFDNQLSSGAFYLMYLKAFGLMLLFVIVIGFLAVAIAPSFSPQREDGGSLSTFIILLYVLFALPYLYLFAYFQAKKFRLILNGLNLDGQHSLSTDLSVDTMFRIYLTNTLAILVTLGLAIPWTLIRTARAKLESLTLESTTSLDDFAAAEGQRLASLGEELGEALDIELGL